MWLSGELNFSGLIPPFVFLILKGKEAGGVASAVGKKTNGITEMEEVQGQESIRHTEGTRKNLHPPSVPGFHQRMPS